MEIAEFYLTDHGATVEEAWNGREAVEKYAANPQKFDVILMDLMMPVMGGLEAARQIRTMELPARSAWSDGCSCPRRGIPLCSLRRRKR